MHPCVSYYVDRMIQAVANSNGAASTDAQPSEGGSIRALIDVVKKEETTVYVDIDTRVKVRVVVHRHALACQAC